MKFLLIAGSRDFDNYAFLAKCLQEYEDKHVTVVSGTARGADKLGEQWAFDHHFAIEQFKPDWNGKGKSAGPIRNIEMADFLKDKDAEVILFWDEKSKGTKHMYDEAKKRNLPVKVYNFIKKEQILQEPVNLT